MRFVLTVILLTGLLSAPAAHAQMAAARPTIFTEEETNPEPLFRGGLTALREFVTRKTIIPQYATANQFGATVDVEFILWPDGRMDSLHISNPVCCGLDEEALRVVELTRGSWTPGLIKGQPVATRVEVNVPFLVNYQTSVSVKRLAELRTSFADYQKTPMYRAEREAHEVLVKQQK